MERAKEEDAIHPEEYIGKLEKFWNYINKSARCILIKRIFEQINSVHNG